MPITNKICAKMCNCKSITVTDTSDWDTLVPATDIVSSLFQIYNSEDELIFTTDTNEYTASVDADSTTPTFLDGEYRVLVTYIDDEDDEYIIEEFVYNVCNIKCKKEQLIRDLALEDGCTSCKDEKLKLALEASILFQALCAAIICKNTSEADKLLAWLEDKLINYKCKSC